MQEKLENYFDRTKKKNHKLRKLAVDFTKTARISVKNCGRSNCIRLHQFLKYKKKFQQNNVSMTSFSRCSL